MGGRMKGGWEGGWEGRLFTQVDVAVGSVVPEHHHDHAAAAREHLKRILEEILNPVDHLARAQLD